MSLQIILVCVLFCVNSVDSATVLSLKNSNTNIHSLKLQNVDEFELIRNKRVSGTSQPEQSKNNRHAGARSGGKSELIVNPFVLNGTETSPFAYMHWIGKGISERVFILTCRQNFSLGIVEESQLWVSSDYGKNYTHKKLGASANISHVYTVPENPRKLIFTDVRAKMIYTTEDELVHFKSHPTPVEPDKLVLHPKDENKLLLYNSLLNELYVSTNFAANWTLLEKNVLPQFYWAVPGYDSNANIVHMEIEGEVPSQAKYKNCVVPHCVSATNLNVGPFLAGSLRVQNEYMVVQKSSSFGAESYLMVSHKRQPFHRAYFPGDVVTDDFIIVNLDDGQMFVAVNHRGYVNLYLSDATGQYFVLSLSNISHVVYPNGFEIHFQEVSGMMWTFLANRIESGTVRTYISFDKGGNWAPLNKSCTVREHCPSRLIMKHSIYSTHILSEESAPGIIMAHGSVGTKASAEEIFLFTSNDGGGTWVKATLAGGKPLTGTFHLNILDRGSILTAIRDSLFTDAENTTKVFYSLDRGLHWEEQVFDSARLRVDGVLTERGLLTRVESVFGHEGEKKPWKIVNLNFSRILSKKCENKDYENWYPRDFNNAKSKKNNCTLGQVVSYQRPRANAKCYNGDAKIKRERSETCSCTSEDFECDFGYYLSDGSCKKAEWFDDSYISPECDHGGTYMKSRGYRKIPADKCAEVGTDKGKYDPVNATCPSVKPAGLVILTEAVKVPTGKKVYFHMEQSKGSKFDTKYTWDFGDNTKIEVDGFHFHNASVQGHTFSSPGHFNVTVTAKNKKGSTTAYLQVHVQETLSAVYIISPWAGKTGREIYFYVNDPDVFGSKPALADREHFVWTFGDEAADKPPLLTWHRNVSHIYKKPGKYRITAEVINSVSSVYTEYNIEILDKVEILELTFSKNLTQYVSFPFIREHFALQIRYQLVKDLGLRLERLEAVQGNELLHVWQLYILPYKGAGEPDVDDIKNKVMDLAKNKKLEINLKISELYLRDFGFPVVSVRELPDSDKKTDGDSGPNLKAVFIAVPTLVLAVLVAGISILYCRKRMRSNRQFNILHSQDDADDHLLDDDSPLDLNADFGSRDHSGDDAMLDIDARRLEISEGSSGNAENC